MGFWTDPDVRNHIDTNSDYRLANLFEKLIINSESTNYGDYTYDTTGETITKMEIYDVSSTALMDKFYELQDSCYDETFPNKLDMKTPKIAASSFDNVTLFPLILLMNKLYSNSEFISSGDVPTYKMLDAETVRNLLYKIDNSKSNTAMEVEDASEYEKILKSNATIKNKHDATLGEIIKAKLKVDSTTVPDTFEYKKLLQDYSESDIKKLVMKLTTYNKGSE